MSTLQLPAADGHGFDCNERADFDPASARLASRRTIELFHRHVR